MASLNRISSGFKPLIITVNTTLTGATSTGPTQFKIPLTDTPTYSGLTPEYRFRVKWGDGISEKIQSFDSVNATHTYSSGGTYTIKIYGQLDRLYFNYSDDAVKITNVDQWGSVIWKDFARAFAGCQNFTGITATDVPKLYRVNDFSEIFSEATGFNYNLSGWNVSNIVNMQYSFFNNYSFNQPIGSWNVGNVENMAYMLANANLFNQNLGEWNIQNVQYMDLILSNSAMNTENYNLLLTGWTGWISGSATKNVKTGVTFDIGSVSSSGTSAASARLYLINTKSWTINDGDPNVVSPSTFISVWDTTLGLSSGTTITLPLVSSGNYNFTVYWGDGSSDTITAYNQPEVSHTYSSNGVKTIYIDGTIDGWSFDFSGVDPQKITSVLQWGNLRLGNDGGYFKGCSNLDLNNVVDVLNLGTTNNLTDMFKLCTSLTTVNNINSWNFSGVTSMYGTFYVASSFDQDLSGIDVSNVTDFRFTFGSASSFNNGGSANINNWDVSSSTNLGVMFGNASSFNQPIGNWDVSNVLNMGAMLIGTSLDTSNYNDILTGWTGWIGGIPTKTVQSNVTFSVGTTQYTLATDAQSARDYLINTKSWTITDGGGVLPPTVFASTWDTTLGDGLPVITLPLESSGTYNFTVYWGDGTTDTITSYSSTTKTHNYLSTGIETIYINGDLNGWAFNYSLGDKSKIVSIEQWGDLRLGNNGSYFSGCDNLDLSGVVDILNLSGTTNLNVMFGECYSLTTVNNINSWDVSNVTNMESMFTNSSFNQPLSGWNVSNVTDMGEMFSTTPFNQPIGNWDVSNVIIMDGMFHNSQFNQPISGWNVSSVGDMGGMFEGAANFNQPIGNWNVSGVTYMGYMFNGASNFNQPLSGWNVSNVINMSHMFSASQFNQPIGSWNVSGVTDMGSMLDNYSLNTSNYNDILTGWTGWIGGIPTKSVLNNVNFGAGITKYSSGTTANDARNYLVTGKTWTISDGGGI